MSKAEKLQEILKRHGDDYLSDLRLWLLQNGNEINTGGTRRQLEY